MLGKAETYSQKRKRGVGGVDYIGRGSFGLPHFAWLCMFFSILIWPGIVPTSGGGGNLGNSGNFYRIILVFLAAASGIYSFMMYSRASARNANLSIWLFLIYGGVAFLSSILIDKYAFYIMWKATEVVLDVIIILAILGRRPVLSSIWLSYKSILVLYFFLLVSAWFGAVVSPSSAFLASRGLIPFTIQGVYPVQNGNSLAFVSAVICLASVVRYLRGEKGGGLYLVLFVAAFVTLVLGQSRTSLVGLFVALIVFFFLNKNRRLLFSILGVGLPIAIASGFSEVFAKYFMRSQSTELFMSLSGRTQGWEAAWHSFLEHPVFGSGFAAAARSEILGITGASTLHGALFDVIVGVGLLGLIPWLGALIYGAVTLKKAVAPKRLRRMDKRTRSIMAEMAGVFTLIVIRSLTSSGISMHENTFMLLLSVFAFVGYVYKNKIERIQ